MSDRALALVLSSIFLSGICWAQRDSVSSGSPMIIGTLTYPLRVSLAPEAAIDLRLEDVSRADAPATLIAENIFAAAGKQVPIPFQLPYSQNDIHSDHRYQVRANITVHEKLLFTTTSAYPVITNGAPAQVDLVLQPVSSRPGGPKSSAVTGEANARDGKTAELRGTVWRLTELNGQLPATPFSNNTAQLLIDATENRFSGSTGCNRMGGTFEKNGGSLHFNPAAQTMMACPEPLMKQEQAFAAALQSVTSFRITGRALELLAGETVVARFKAVNLEQSSD